MPSRWIAVASAAVLAAPLLAHAAAPPGERAFLPGSSERLGILAPDLAAPLVGPMPADAGAQVPRPEGPRAPNPFDDELVLGMSALRSSSAGTTYSYLAGHRRSLVDLRPLLSGSRLVDGAPLAQVPERRQPGTSYTIVERAGSAGPDIPLPATAAAIASALCGAVALAWRWQHRSGGARVRGGC